jgi:hypothetical protein
LTLAEPLALTVFSIEIHTPNEILSPNIVTLSFGSVTRPLPLIPGEVRQLEGHEPVVDSAELNAPELDHVDVHEAGGGSVEQPFHQRSGS